MDVDVEMVDCFRPGQEDEIVAADNFRDTDIVDNPTVRRQNICFLVAMFTCLVGFSVYVVGRIYMFPFEEGLFGGGMGTQSGESGEVDNNDTIKKVSIVNEKYAHSHGKGWSKTHPKQHGSNESIYHVNAKTQAWLSANVTKDDGVMYEIIAQLHHDDSAFTEGLCFVEGRLFESTGMERQSLLKELDPETGKTISQWPLAKQDFGEGLTYAHGYFLQLTWQQHKGYKYDYRNLSAPPVEFEFQSKSGEGWGLTFDHIHNELIESDGSNFLNIWDPETLKPKRTVEVYRLDGTKAKNMNELEMWRGRILANVWYEDVMIVIHPETGRVEKEYDLSELYKSSLRRQDGADVLNGISVSNDEDILYVTGKNWDRMYKLRLLPTINERS